MKTADGYHQHCHFFCLKGIDSSILVRVDSKLHVHVHVPILIANCFSYSATSTYMYSVAATHVAVFSVQTILVTIVCTTRWSRIASQAHSTSAEEESCPVHYRLHLHVHWSHIQNRDTCVRVTRFLQG